MSQEVAEDQNELIKHCFALFDSVSRTLFVHPI